MTNKNLRLVYADWTNWLISNLISKKVRILIRKLKKIYIFLSQSAWNFENCVGEKIQKFRFLWFWKLKIMVKIKSEIKYWDKSDIPWFNRNVEILFGIENRLFTVRKSSLICSTSFILIRYDLIIPIILEKSNWNEQNRFDSDKSFLDHFKDCLKIYTILNLTKFIIAVHRGFSWYSDWPKITFHQITLKLLYSKVNLTLPELVI